MDTAARQSIPAILTWLENSLPACMAHKPEIGGKRRNNRQETRRGGNGEEKCGRLRYNTINITVLWVVIKPKSIHKSPDRNKKKHLKVQFLPLFIFLFPPLTHRVTADAGVNVLCMGAGQPGWALQHRFSRPFSLFFHHLYPCICIITPCISAVCIFTSRRVRTTLLCVSAVAISESTCTSQGWGGLCSTPNSPKRDNLPPLSLWTRRL